MIQNPDPAELDIKDFYQRMRAMDVLELHCQHPDSSATALMNTAMHSPDETLAVFIDGELHALGGLFPTDIGPSVKCPWLVMTNDVLRVAKPQFMSWTSQVNRRWQQRFDVLANSIHAENTVTIRWLEGMNYTVEPDVEFKADEPFRNFYHVRTHSHNRLGNLSPVHRDGGEGHQ